MVLHKTISRYGLIALAIAVAEAIAAGAGGFGLALYCGCPILLAAFFVWYSESYYARRTAWAFFLLIGIGAIIANFPDLMPNLGKQWAGVGPAKARLLSWYSGMYLLFFSSIWPIISMESLGQLHRGEPAALSSRGMCYFVLLFFCFVLVGAVIVLDVIGFWPIL